MSGDDFTQAEHAAIAMLRNAAKALPDDFFAVDAVQELACLYVKLEPLLTEDQKAVIIGAGAYVAKQADLEMKAQIQASMAILKAKGDV